MKLFISAGESSGDALGGRLLIELSARLRSLRAFGMGGPDLIAAGLQPWARMEAVSVTGLTDVLPKVPTLMRLLGRLAGQAINERPDVAVLIDLPDFHLRLARRLRRAGIPVVQYVAPSVWAWRSRRVHAFARAIDEVLVLFPFEVPFWASAGVPVRWVGHPLVDELKLDASLEGQDGTLALLPGSRPGEVCRLLPVLLSAAQRIESARRFVLPVAPGLDRRWIEERVRASGLSVEQIDGADRGAKHQALRRVQAAAACAGTVTLELALLQKPMVVVYRTDWLTWNVLRPLVRVEHMALPNLLGARVPELIQGDLNVASLAQAMRALLDAPGAEQRAGLRALRRDLEPPGGGTAAGRAAEAVIDRARRFRSGPESPHG